VKRNKSSRTALVKRKDVDGVTMAGEVVERTQKCLLFTV
jgi:hypothetical protein